MHQDNKHSFENFIIQCCKAKEWTLRTFLKKKLIKAGFSIQEDSYLSSRCRSNDKYSKVHNLLAIRGNPRVGLVAHTDVCRDHGFASDGKAPDVNPVIKDYPTEDGKDTRKIIQDKDCLFQTGGDDRLGVAINMWIALNTGYDIALLFTTDEEIGLVSASQVRFPELKEMDLLVQVDRGNHTNQLVTRIGGVQLCSPKTAKRLLKVASDMGVPRDEVNGLLTDVQCIIRNGVAREAVNMTCGYHNSYGESNKEFIDVEEARSTMKYVSSIVQYYDLKLDQNEEEDDKEEESSNYNHPGTRPMDLEMGDIEIEEYIQLISKSKEKSYKNLKRRRKKYDFSN